MRIPPLVKRLAPGIAIIIAALLLILPFPQRNPVRCLIAGGTYDYLRIPDQVMCNYPTDDGMEPCTASEACRSYCVVDMAQEVCPKGTDTEQCTAFPDEWPEAGVCWPYQIIDPVDPTDNCVYMVEGYVCFD